MLKKTLSSILVLLIISAWQVQAQPATSWQRYDESADLARLAEHSNASMHFRLLNSRVLDKNTLWAAFDEALEQFSVAQYDALKPIILNRSIAQLQHSVATGVLDYETLVTFYLYRIRQIETDNAHYLNAIISLNPQAITRARQLDRIRREGTNAAADPLFGMPVLLKDNIGFSELPTTAGAIALQDNMTGNAFITKQLLARGAIVLGKANLSEWAYFFCNDCPSGYSALGGQTLNPYGRFEFSSGGSSAGSGAAIAANLAVVAVGTETSGSILSPASANSLVGLKPTTGSLSRSGIIPISATLDTAGPMARTVADVVSLFNAMAGFDHDDVAMPLLSEDYKLQYRTVSLAGMRLGVQPELNVNRQYRQAVALLTENGASAVSVALKSGPFPRFSEFLGAEMQRDLPLYLAHDANANVPIASIADLQAFNRQDLSTRAPYAQELVDMMAGLTLSPDELDALRDNMQTLARTQLEQLFEEQQLDVLLSINNTDAGLAALANYPALTIPAGYNDAGRPVGLTLIAPGFSEQLLIDIGATYEQLSQARRAPDNY